MLHLRFWALLVLLLLTHTASRPARRPTLYLIGDSTVRNGAGKGADRMWGWGSFLAEHFDTTRIRISNQAIGGRSSRTFLTEGRWGNILHTLQPGDYVLMQFGHNDGGPVNDTLRARGTLKGIGPETEDIRNLLTQQAETVHTYGWYMRRYVADTKARGATPIVCSLVPRNVWQGGRVQRNAADYAGWAAAVAKSENAYFIDLNERVARQYDALGDEQQLKATYFVQDHTNEAGARLNAATVVQGIRDLKKCPLRKYLR
ncbi:rhamnogalacturonan acetylesterase [Hymenobacter sp. CRA2]|uniref:rhamnogalacturonan acetylesterase n=1 Tax=Hymenobacter sp. CRA2 TaxID=1955620 RepID=UPI00098F0254|nr:rhamnogalacturonan acetylesterase [Hymenobacter sp. CRA2]OON66497.1 lysophospholipase [Hymenobacter sp. CRA2]